MSNIDESTERRRAPRERLSWSEIKQRYPDEWVVVLDAERVEGDGIVISGVVYAHGAEREHLSIPRRFRPATSATIVWTGARPVIVSPEGIDGIHIGRSIRR